MVELSDMMNQMTVLKEELNQTRQALAISESRRKIVFSQIQPHFLFNALGTIEYLCGSDSALAQTALHNFSKYLRMNLTSMVTSEKVGFEKELEYTKTYLWIEKLRFQEDLEIIYDVDFTDFMIPSMTLQPIVENAVRHGICNKLDGGTLKISCHKDHENAVIVVEDNGIGFDLESYKKDEKKYKGIKIVRNRLKTISGASLKLESCPLKGSRVTIQIPL